jgi:transposase
MARRRKERVKRRRSWSTAEKDRLVKETMKPGTSVSAVARRVGLAPAQLSQWRRQSAEGGLQAVQPNEKVGRTSGVRELERRVSELEREVEDLKAAVATQAPKADTSKRIKPISNKKLAKEFARAGITEDEVGDLARQADPGDAEGFKADPKGMFRLLRRLPLRVQRELLNRVQTSKGNIDLKELWNLLHKTAISSAEPE